MIVPMRTPIFKNVINYEVCVVIVYSFIFCSVDVVEAFYGVNERPQAVPGIENICVTVEWVLASYVFAGIIQIVMQDSRGR